MKITFKRVLLWGGAAFCLFAAWLAWQLTGAVGPITVSPQTTVITQPLADDGLPDFSRWMLDQMREGVTAENNGAIPFLQAMWPMDLQGPQQMTLCQELEIDLPDTEGMKDPHNSQQLGAIAKWLELQHGVETEGEAAQELSSNLIQHAGGTPWQREQLPPLADWIDRHASEFELLHKAADRPNWYLPSPGLLLSPNEPFVVLLLPQVQVNRSAWRCLLTRANYHLGEANPTAAWRDCNAVYELAEKCSGQFLVGELVSIAGNAMANQTARNILDHPSLTPQLAQRIHAYLQAQTPRRRMADTIDRDERLGFVTSILSFSGQRPTNDPSIGAQAGPMSLLAGISMDWDLILTIGNDWYDQLAEAMRIENYAERTAALQAIDTQMKGLAGPGVGGVLTGVISRKSRSKSVANVLAGLLLPAISAASAAEDRANIDLALMQTAAALALFQQQTGDYPASLDELTPQLLARPPHDLFTGKPLVYQKTPAGYLLYSLGPNGSDDGGSSDRRQRYLGYEVDSNDQRANAAVCELLGEPAEKPITSVAGMEDELEPNWLKHRIPPGADDHAIRLPLPRIPLPKLEPFE